MMCDNCLHFPICHFEDAPDECPYFLSNDKEIRKEKKEVKHGEWIDKGSLSCRCSNCGCKSSKESKFCSECGADMRERKEAK